MLAGEMASDASEFGTGDCDCSGDGIVCACKAVNENECDCVIQEGGVRSHKEYTPHGAHGGGAAAAQPLVMSGMFGSSFA